MPKRQGRRLAQVVGSYVDLMRPLALVCHFATFVHHPVLKREHLGRREVASPGHLGVTSMREVEATRVSLQLLDTERTVLRRKVKNAVEELAPALGISGLNARNSCQTA